MMNARKIVCCLVTAFLFISVVPVTGAEDYEQEPINYSKSQPHNRVSQLIEQLESGRVNLQHEPHFGYLRSLLRELKVSISSQMLVFSKTSMQRQRIAARTPRALYFSDDVFVGFCQQGEVLEISAVDPQLGAVFYTVDQDNTERPRITRQGDNCLICHSSSQTKEVPGHLVRSVFAEASGLPVLSAGTFRVDHTSPLEQRWGGWYVTGTHGQQKHLGNFVVSGNIDPGKLDNASGMNLQELDNRFKKSAYLTAYSDIVALMVLEHQAQAHNLITRASFATRQAMHYQTALNRELGESPDHEWESTKSRICSAGDSLVEYLLFSGEAALTHRIEGTTSFADDFVQQGPRDRKGRSLRDFDLERRLFKYPCSYLIYSPSFQTLPIEVKNYVLQRIGKVLSGQDQSHPFAHLSATDRQAILEILQDTFPDLSDAFHGVERNEESS